MRLKCPNCEAQYEVPDEVIPLSGRDVQCSNCGDTWFQTHPANPDAVPPMVDDEDLDEAEPQWEDDHEEHVEEAARESEPHPEQSASEDAAETDQQLESDDYTEDAAWDEGTDDAQEDPPAPERKPLNEDVTSVLREEAKREQQARQADQGGLETQPDLGLTESDEVERRLQQAKARMARLRGLDTENAGVAEAEQEPEIDLGTRRNLLPEIEDVDQRIEAEAEGAAEAASARDGSRVATQKEGPSGFGRGMRLSIFLAVVAAALYMFAPQFSAMVPALEGALSGYTQIVDQGRAILQAQLGGVAEQVKGMIGG